MPSSSSSVVRVMMLVMMLAMCLLGTSLGSMANHDNDADHTDHTLDHSDHAVDHTADHSDHTVDHTADHSDHTLDHTLDHTDDYTADHSSDHTLGHTADHYADHSTPGCGHELLLFEFTTFEDPAMVKMRFNHVNVVFSHKVLGVGHYFFVVEEDHDGGVEHLSLPPDATYMAKVTPVERSTEHMRRLGMDVGVERVNPHPLPHHNVTLVELTWLAEGLNQAQYRASLHDMADSVADGYRMSPAACLVPVGELPARFLWYAGQDSCQAADFILEHSDPFGGPGGFKTRVLKLHHI